MKKLLIALGSLIFLLLAAAIIIPLVVDVDKYRPQIVNAANEKINGKLELGKLSLSLWGQVRVQVAGVNLTDQAGNKVLAVQDAYFHVPFSSIFGGAPLLTFKMEQPTVNVIKDKNGRLNVMTLMKEQPSEAVKKEAPPSEQAKGPETQTQKELPSIVRHARLGIELRNALVTYKDLATHLDTQIKDLNFVARDLSLSRETEMELWADLDTKMGQSMIVRGPVKMSAKADPKMSGSRLENLKLTAKVDLDQLEIEMPNTFHKKKGIAANADMLINATEKDAKIDRFDVKFFNAEVKTSGTVTLPPPVTAGATPTPPSVNIAVHSNEIELKPWVELLPMLKDYDLGGSAKLDAEAKGPTDKLDYKAKFVVNKLTAKAPNLKTQPQIDALVSVVTDQVDNLTLTMKAPGNDLKVHGTVVSFLKPVANFNVTSSGMDLDQLINFPPKGAKKAEEKPKAGEEKAPAEKTAPTGKPAPAQDLDATTQPIRENPVIAATNALINVDMRMIKARNITISDIKSKMTFKNLIASIDSFGMRLWDGSIGANMAVNLQHKTPSYQFGTKVAGLDLSKAVSSELELFKNTILGKADFSMNGSGASFNSDQAIGNLNAKGSMKVSNATFATIDVSRMAKEALNKVSERIGDKIPAAKGKTIGNIPSGETRYQYISSDFSIAGGRFVMPNFVAKAEPSKGIDIKGTTEVSLKDNSLKTSWELIDTYNFTKAADLSIEQAGVKVDHVLAEGNNPVKFPIQAGCTIQAPCYSYTQVPEYLVGVAFNNVTRAATGKVKAEATKKAEELIKKNAPPAVQDKIQDFRKKLFGQ